MRGLLLLLLFTAHLRTIAQSGGNYTCALAYPLEVAASNVQSFFVPVFAKDYPSAVPEPITACSGNTVHGSAWFTFIATATTHWIRTEGEGLDDSGMEVFSGSCGSLTSIGCFAPLSTTPMVSGLSVGTTYYLRVLMIPAASCGATNCQGWVAVVSAPLHDECANAIELLVLPPTLGVHPSMEISTLGATQSQLACAGNGAANDDVWYRFIATDAVHFFPVSDLFVPPGDNIALQWFSGACGNLTSIGCGVASVTGLTPGQPYYIRAYSESIDPVVSLRKVADMFAPSPNDECTGAVPITVAEMDDAPVPLDINTLTCTPSTVPCGTTDRDVWLTFEAPSTSVMVVSSTSAHHAALFSGTCGGLVCVSQGSLAPDREFNGLTPGTTYHLKIGSTNLGTRNTRVWVFSTATNTACADAIDLAIQTGAIDWTEGHNYGSSLDVWYSFTATAARHFVEVLATSTPLPMHAQVYSGTCGSLTSIALSSDMSTPLAINGLVAGQQYLMRVSSTNEAGFRVAVRTPMANDDCSGALPLTYSTVADFGTALVRSNEASDGTGGCSPTRDLWYQFTAAYSEAGIVAAAQTLSNNFTLELFSGTCGTLTSLGCFANTGSARARYSGLSVGSSYFLRVSMTNVSIFQPLLFAPNANDGITGALAAPWGTQFAQPLYEAWNYAATQSYATHCTGALNTDDDTWFHFTAAASSHTITAEQRNDHFYEDPLPQALQIEVYDQFSTDDATLDANMISCGNSPRAMSGLTIGQQYWYRVYSVPNGPASTCAFTTVVSGTSNDEASGAMELAYGSAYTALFDTDGATQSLPGADCTVDDFADDDIWFKFTATASPARVVVGYHTADLTLQLFSGTPGNLTSISCDDNMLVLPTLTSGQTYYVRLYSWADNTQVAGRIGLYTTPSLTANTCVDETCLGPALLPNPSIEQGEQCYAVVGSAFVQEGSGMTLAPGWPWYQFGSADAFSSCADFDHKAEAPALQASGGGNPRRLVPRSGKGMGGVYAKDILPYFEYMEAPLSEPLVPGEAYLVSFHVATVGGSVLCLDGIGAALTEGPVVGADHTDPLPITPDVITDDIICSSDWTNICGIVFPTSAVDHITIGEYRALGEVASFGTYAGQSSYYFIDDVVVALVTDPGCITGLGDVPPLYESASGEGDDLRVYPNPASDRVNIVCDAGLFGQRGVIEVFDATGKRVHAEQVASLSAVHPLDLSSEWREGLYLLMVRVEGQAPRSSRVVVKR